MQRQDFKKTDDMFNRVLSKDHITVICLFENIQAPASSSAIHRLISIGILRIRMSRSLKLLAKEVEKIANTFALLSWMNQIQKQGKVRIAVARVGSLKVHHSPNCVNHHVNHQSTMMVLSPVDCLRGPQFSIEFRCL